MTTSINAILVVTTLVIASVLPFSARGAEVDNASLAARLAAAKPGDVITLEAGSFQVGDLKIPSGVSLRGAGFNKTVLDAAGHKDGLTITDAANVTVSDLTIKNAQEAGVSAQRSSDVTLKRLAVISNLTGLLLCNLKDSRIENAVVAKNRTGASFVGNVHTALVNCSLVDNSALALSLANNQNSAVFNNVLVNSATGIYLTTDNAGLLLDHNLYFASVLGKMEGEATRTSISGWQRLTGMDAHSLSTPVDFADAAQDDYHPTSTLAWAPNLVTTAGWGAASLGGFDAPSDDVSGQNRSGTTDLGAYVVKLSPPRKADGTFTIVHEDGVKSAALYDANGVQVAILFQNLPLSVGQHEFWVPNRDTWNRLIPAGSYEVRLVESQLNNPYLGLAGTFNLTSKQVDGCSWPEEQFAFDAQDRIYVLQNAFENGVGVRAYDPDYKKVRWMMPGGGGTIGSAVDDKDLYYMQWDFASKKFNLRKLNLETGLYDPIAPKEMNRIFSGTFSGQTYGMAFFKGRLYVSDPGQGKVFYTDANDPKFTQSYDLPGALSVTADQKNGLLWVINNEGKLLTLDPASGAIKPVDVPTPGIKRISANNGLLAALSTKTGKIDIYDINDPQQPKLVHSIGTGDGPFGPIKPDRFWFQEPQTPGLKFAVSINSKGEVAVVDDKRISFWGADGSLKKQGFGFWGQHNYVGRFAGADDVRAWGMDSPYCIKFDCKNKSWTPDTRWQMPTGYVYEGRSMRNVFSTGGKNFGVYLVNVGDPGKTADGKLQIAGTPDANGNLQIDPKVRTLAYLVVRFDDVKAVPVSLYYRDSKLQTLVEVHDTNHDGIIDAQDEAHEIRKADGSGVGIPGDRYGGLPWDDSGDLVYAGKGIVKMTGLDPTGTWPVYDWASIQSLVGTFDGKSTNMISPYDYKYVENINNTVQVARMSDGGYASSINFPVSSGGTGLANGAGTDIAGFSKDGILRWFYRCNTVEGSEGVQSIPKFNLVLGMTTKECDYMVMDNDGLGLGVLSMPKEAHWLGMWSDHAQQQQAWVGNDGQPYYILGDYAANGFHWFQITGMEKTVRQRIPVQIGADEATQLAAGPDNPPITARKPAGAKFTIHRLAQPFQIDGDMKKWRDAGIAPTALITPDTGSADITGPKDCSAVVRVAYQGSDLYVQTIVFRQQVAFFQPLDKMYQQDGIEMGINGFMEGFKYNVGITTDKGPVIYRNKFVSPSFDRIYTPEQAPLSIKVLDNARDVEERHLIEAIYGVDLSDCKVVVTEFKLPLTPEVGLDGDPKLVTVAPGNSFYLGFYINANDQPGGDVQKLLAWPATYGPFLVKTSGAMATFE